MRSRLFPTEGPSWKEYIFWPFCEACRILVPQPGIKPTPPALEVWILNHWITREFPGGLS